MTFWPVRALVLRKYGVPVERDGLKGTNWHVYKAPVLDIVARADTQRRTRKRKSWRKRKGDDETACDDRSVYESARRGVTGGRFDILAD